MAEQQSRTWITEFDHPPEVIWSLMADTARFNEASGLPIHIVSETVQPDGSVLAIARAKIGPVKLEWREIPANWISGQWLEHNRLFTRGPLRFLGAEIELEPSDRGCRMTYRVRASPANWFGRLVLATGFFRAAERSFRRMTASANAYAKGEAEQVFPYTPPPVSPGLRSRLDRIIAEIEATPNGHGLARRLADFVVTAQEVDLWHIRPLGLAHRWNRPALHVIELCLQAVRSGLLELRWDLLCPSCRGAKAWSGTLDQLPRKVHCPTCNIDYDREFSRNVEASFRPSPAIRALETGEYCVWGPMSEPHVKLQVAIAPGENRDFSLALVPGPFRLRTFEGGPVEEIDWHDDHRLAFAHLGDTIRRDDLSIAGENPRSPKGRATIRLENRSDRWRTFVIEDRHWIAEALTADRVTALQAFRDLFSDDVLRPGDDVTVGHVALLFTDLKGSTALYRRVGDAAAYRLVRNHFAFLTAVIRAHEGTVVKTIGDAVMAAFIDNNQAVAAALAIQGRIADFNRENGLSEGLVIKLGIHAGPVIAVTLNDRLDYFGSTVNMAARLQGQSVGGDLILSAEVAAGESLAPLLSNLTVLADQAVLKGFDTPQPFVRVRP
ncbi:adenylate/guanylate cyclase domain-containing protein [Dongia soli]|uniref:Adenylate/guanylate cyclase domain-containing protein n=1 Tax=Dongia soli TaxID=600628 RepID=A0ABU5E893_9PROT|nr:adenylate/guanylate cyclase domain-containing protein [Dongia soli]MDY0882428.1 adenylate/guanylate cyclase domain-containing protein [Dongia soli]